MCSKEDCKEHIYKTNNTSKDVKESSVWPSLKFNQCWCLQLSIKEKEGKTLPVLEFTYRAIGHMKTLKQVTTLFDIEQVLKYWFYSKQHNSQ